ncbi:MAG: hypothetical protein ACW98I_18170 [Candidatus Hodarchaeales archaeon]|jgi:hypothetical protein
MDVALLFEKLIVSSIFGFLLALALGIGYYRLKWWLDPYQEDVPEFDGLAFTVGSQIIIHIISERLLPFRSFYLIGVVSSIIIFLLSFVL